MVDRMIDEREYDRVRGVTIVRDPNALEVKINPKTGDVHCPPEVYDTMIKRLPKKRYVMK